MCTTASPTPSGESEKRTENGRRSNKPLMEKKRRQRINACLNELKSLVLEAQKKDPSRYSKLEKADILEMTVRHVQSLQRQESRGGPLGSKEAVPTGKYRAGFTQCAAEVTRFLSGVKGLPHEVHARLLQHLQAVADSVTPDPSPSSPTSASVSSCTAYGRASVKYTPNLGRTGLPSLVLSVNTAAPGELSAVSGTSVTVAPPTTVGAAALGAAPVLVPSALRPLSVSGTGATSSLHLENNFVRLAQDASALGATGTPHGTLAGTAMTLAASQPSLVSLPCLIRSEATTVSTATTTASCGTTTSTVNAVSIVPSTVTSTYTVPSSTADGALRHLIPTKGVGEVSLPKVATTIAGATVGSLAATSSLYSGVTVIQAHRLSSGEVALLLPEGSSHLSSSSSSLSGTPQVRESPPDDAICPPTTKALLPTSQSKVPHILPRPSPPKPVAGCPLSGVPARSPKPLSSASPPSPPSSSSSLSSSPSLPEEPHPATTASLETSLASPPQMTSHRASVPPQTSITPPESPDPVSPEPLNLVTVPNSAGSRYSPAGSPRTHGAIFMRRPSSVTSPSGSLKAPSTHSSHLRRVHPYRTPHELIQASAELEASPWRPW